MIRLESLTRPDLIFPDLAGSDSATVLRHLAERTAAHLPSTDPADLYSRLVEREQLGSTGIGSGVAIPHCKLEGLERAVLAVGIVPGGVEFGALDERPVQVFFLVVSPSDSPAEHLQVLAAISRWVKADHHVDRILAQRSREDIYALLREEGP